MFTFRFSSFIPYFIVLFAILSFSACGDARTPAQPTDPGTAARRVVAEYLSVPITEVTLISLEAQDFNNSSLGCPEPDMAYQQVVTPGHRARIEAEGRRFDVRVAGGHGKICRNNWRKGSTSHSGSEAAVSSMANLARRELAKLLDIGVPKIYILDIRPYDGKNPPTGCKPQCAVDDESCGYILGLSYDGRRYDYHATDGQVAACPPILRR